VDTINVSVATLDDPRGHNKHTLTAAIVPTCCTSDRPQVARISAQLSVTYRSTSDLLIFDPRALRGAYRETITTLPDAALYRKTVDEGVAAEPCYFCMESWEIGQDAVKLRCECPHWTHEACLAKAAFETGGCPTCRTSMLALDDEIVLECAATDGDLSKVTSLLQQGIQPSPPGFADWTPLLAAAKAGHQEIVRSLLVLGASVSEQDRYQRTALYWASKGGHPETIAELLSRGAVLSSVHEWGYTLLHLAVESRSTETVALLLDHGSDLSARDRDGKSALHIAVERRNKQIVSLLVGRGAEVNLMDERGCTPLHYAAQRNYGRVTKLLLDGGADATIRDMTGRTVTDWAKGKDPQYALEALDGKESTGFILFRGNFIEP